MRSSALICALLLGLAGTLSAGDPTPLIRGRFDLVEAKTGRNVTERSYDGTCRMVFFGFTRCPLTCPLGLHTIAKVLALLGPDASKVKCLFITIDPARDTAKVMNAYLSGYDPRIAGLGGSKKAISAAVRDFRLEAERGGAGDDYLLEHPAIIYVMGKKGEYLKTLPSRGSADAIALELRATINKIGGMP